MQGSPRRCSTDIRMLRTANFLKSILKMLEALVAFKNSSEKKKSAADCKAELLSLRFSALANDSSLVNSPKIIVYEFWYYFYVIVG